MDMNFRTFVYYCALCGAWFAFLGWIPGRWSEGIEHSVAQAGIKGLCLGLFLALGLGTVDAVWNLALRQFVQIFLRVAVAVVIGLIGGMVGGMIGQVLVNWTSWTPFIVFGWTLTGLLIGASLGVFEMTMALLSNQELGGAMRKILKGVVGGTLGGLLGGTLYLLLGGVYASFFDELAVAFGDRFRGLPSDQFWFPSATGFAVLGACIGLLIGVAQVILKEAWIKIEKGRRSGREIMITKSDTSIGRAEICDIGLFGDNGIERVHARIQQQRQGYVVKDMGTPGGTFVNGQRIVEPRTLRDGDLVQVGASVLRFRERAKRT
jgi:hypothetical protein